MGSASVRNKTSRLIGFARVGGRGGGDASTTLPAVAARLGGGEANDEPPVSTSASGRQPGRPPRSDTAAVAPPPFDIHVQQMQSFDDILQFLTHLSRIFACDLCRVCTKPLTLGTGAAYAEHETSSQTPDPVPTFAPTATDTETHCPYCAFQCGIRLGTADDDGRRGGQSDVSRQQGRALHQGVHVGRDPAASGPPADPARADQRRDARPGDAGTRRSIASRRGLRATQESYGPHAVGVFGGGSLTNEKAYLLGKFARVALGTREHRLQRPLLHVRAARRGDQGVRRRSRPAVPRRGHREGGRHPARRQQPGRDDAADHAVLRGAARRGGTLIVVDPRRTATAQSATLHLRLTPGSDAALANGLLHLAAARRRDRPGVHRRAHRRASTKLRGVAATYWPERTETRHRRSRSGARARRRVCSARATRPMVLTGARPRAAGAGRQQRARVTSTSRSRSDGSASRSRGFGTITGQGNGQGGREHGQKADQLPGYRRIDDPAARAHIAAVWGIPAEEIPGPGKIAYELLDDMGRDGGVRALFVMGSNPVVSAPACAARRGAAARARPARRLRLLPLRDRRAGGRRAAERAVGRRGRHDDEPRGARHPPPARDGSAGGVRTDIEILVGLAERLGTRRALRLRRRRGGVRRAAPRHGGGAPTTPASPTTKIEAQTACSGPAPPTTPGTPRLFAERFATPSGTRALSRRAAQSPAEEPDARLPALPHDRPRDRALPVGHADAPRRAARRASRPSRSRRCNPHTARRAGDRRRRAR